jgi:hypothetical protein
MHHERNGTVKLQCPVEIPLTIEAQTVRFWSQRTGQECSHEEARQMVANVTGFFAVLAEWDHRSRESQICRVKPDDEKSNDWT